MKIENIHDLRQERTLTRIRLKELEQRIEKDFSEIKEDMKPANIAGRALKSMLSSRDNNIVGESISMTVDGLIKGLLFRKSGFLTKTIVAFIAKNYARNMVSKNSENILDWVQTLLSKLKGRHHQNGHHYYDGSTADMDIEGY